ncbi:hypothetical protein [Mycobacterium sp. GA-1841]|uniref:hypothetical protein n=1 Tax=Mycobacterium sp. GA-1841 TaxID=1834154 RepID=UPI0009F8445D|nr:hypothetical protein [Mycobacterium sp. GA-1841]
MTADKDDQEPPEAPWHHSTPAVAGASAAALAVIGLVVWAAIALTSPESEDAPIDFVPPAYTSTSAKTTTTTTTTRSTTTRPLETTEFGLPDVSDTSGTSTTSTTTGTSEPTETSETSTTTYPPHTQTSSPYDDEYSTTRNRPRTNVTRTVYPAPGG